MKKEYISLPRNYSGEYSRNSPPANVKEFQEKLGQLAFLRYTRSESPAQSILASKASKPIITDMEAIDHFARFIITTKDVRTWNANTLFLEYLKKIKKNSKGKENSNIKKDIKKAIEMVAEKLHNTYSICKKSYIDPEIIANAEKQIKIDL